jgi:hypothetical protein
MMEGILRITLGERCLTWKWEDVERGLEQNEEELEDHSKKRMTTWDHEDSRKGLLNEYYGHKRGRCHRQCCV